MDSPLRLTRAGTIFLLTGMALATAGCAHGDGVVSGCSKDASLAELHRRSDREWARGHVLESILTLEHACALVVVWQVEEEGALDYVIKTRVRELLRRGDRASIATILSSSGYFPQASGWIVEWTASDFKHVLPSVNPAQRMKLRRQADAFDKRLAKEAARNPGSYPGRE